MEASDGALHLNGTKLRPVGATTFQAEDGSILEFHEAPAAGNRPAAIRRAPAAADVRFEPVSAFDPTPAQLEEYVGTFRSDEAEASYAIVVEDGMLVVKDRYGEGMPLTPAYADVFSAGGSSVLFRRDQAGRVMELSLSQSRVWDLRFNRLP